MSGFAQLRDHAALHLVNVVSVRSIGGGDILRRQAVHRQALEYLRNAVGILKARAGSSDTPIRFVTVNSSGSWGMDPVREDLAMCSARLEVVAHLENVTIN